MHIRGFISGFLSITALIILIVGFFSFDRLKRYDLVVPRTIVGNISLAWMSRSEATQLIHNTLQDFLQTPFLIAARGEVKRTSFKEMAIDIDENAIVEEIPFAREMSNIELIIWSLGGRRLLPKTAVTAPITHTELLRIIDEKFPAIPRAQNAHLARQDNNLVVIDEVPGVKPNLQNLTAQLTESITFLEPRTVFVDFMPIVPNITRADLAAHRAVILKHLPKSVALAHNENGHIQRFKIDLEKNPHWFTFDRKPYAVADGDSPFAFVFDPIAFSRFLIDMNIAKELEQEADNIRMWIEKDDKVHIEGFGNDGRAIERDRLLTLINNALNTGVSEVNVPLVKVPPKLNVSPELHNFGVRELLAVGHTRFQGSPPNRIHNIGVGVSKYNGLLIPPGETFSFNDNLGVVDASTGFKKELVIKPEGTIPEFGGGLCQVSTTLYRGVMYAGLPIKERAPHSYAVRYYAQVGGHGLDATIYPPSRDLKFINDTPGHILIHSYVQGINAYFKLYGTSDGRDVKLDGPFISNKRSAPSEPLIVSDPTLKPGEKKQVEKPHAGFDSLWHRSISKNGQTSKEAIISRYKAVPAKYLIGGEVTAEGENKGLLGDVNPFD